MSTTELDKAAREASEATGLSVEMTRVGLYAVPRVEIFAPIDTEEGSMPTRS